MYKFKEFLLVLLLAYTCSAQLQLPAAVREPHRDIVGKLYHQNNHLFNQQQYAGRHLTKRVADPSGHQQGTMDSYLKAYKEQHDQYQDNQEAKYHNTNAKRAIKEEDWKPVAKPKEAASKLQFDQSVRYGRSSYVPEQQGEGLGAYKSVLVNAVNPVLNKYFGQLYNKHGETSPVAVTHLNVPLNVQHLNVQLPPELKLYFKQHGMNPSDFQAYAMIDNKQLGAPIHHHQILPSISHQVLPQVSHQILPQVSHQELPQVSHQELPQVSHQLLPQVSHQLLPQVSHQVLPQVSHRVLPHVSHQVLPQITHQLVSHEAHPTAVAHTEEIHSLAKPLENDHHVSDLELNVKDSVIEIPGLQQHHGYDSIGKEVVAQPLHHQVYHHQAAPAVAYAAPSHADHHAEIQHAVVQHEAHGSHEEEAYVDASQGHHELVHGTPLHEGYAEGLAHQPNDLHYANGYAFGYRVLDHKSGNDFGHEEERKGDHTKGHYHVLLPDGRLQSVKYFADKSGFHAKLSYDHQHQPQALYGHPQH